MDELLSVEETAGRLGGISKWTVHVWLSQGRLELSRARLMSTDGAMTGPGPVAPNPCTSGTFPILRSRITLAPREATNP